MFKGKPVEKKIADKLYWIDNIEDDVLDSLVEECRENGIIVDDILNGSDQKDLMEMLNSIGKFYEDGTLVQTPTEPKFYDNEIVDVDTIKNIIIQRFYAAIDEYEEVKLRLEEVGNPWADYSKEEGLALILISIENEFEWSKQGPIFKELKEDLCKFLKIDLEELEAVYEKQTQKSGRKSKSLKK